MGLFSGLIRATLGGSIRRMATGTVLGGLYGGATSDWSAGGVLSGAATGLGIGFLTARAPAGLYRNAAGKRVKSPMVGTALARDLLGATPRTAWAGLKTAGSVGASAAWGAGKFAYRHPFAAAGLAGMGIGAYSMLSSSTGTNVDAMAESAEMAGGTSTLSPVFEASTDNLVQGLHRGRH